MPLLQSMEGKYYDVPEDQATAFEIPRDKVKDVLTKAGLPAPQGGPGGGRRPTPPAGLPVGGSPVIIQVLPNGVHGPSSPPSASGAPVPSTPGEPAGQDGDVDPYFWRWFNWHYGPYWGNRWLNW
jgi:hypothetical protein